ncbi:MAG: response regulator [Bacteroidales bacterium]|nr:response regulator [Bacteroidales bacterium]
MFSKEKNQMESTTILVVEESRTQAEQIEYILKQKSYDSILVSSGNEAYEYLKNNQVSLIICNNIISDMSGTQLSSMINRKFNARKIPFLMYLALFEMDELIDALQAGVDALILQPFQPSVLLHKVKELVSESKSSKELSQKHDILFNYKDTDLIHKGTLSQLTNLLLSSFENATRLSSQIIQMKIEIATLKEELSEKAIENNGMNRENNKMIRKICFDYYHSIKKLEIDLKNIKECDIKNLNKNKSELFDDASFIIRELKKKIQKDLPAEISGVPKPILNYKSTDFRQLVLSALERMNPMADKKRIQIEIDILDSIPEIQLDRDKIDYVIVYLLNQSIGISKPGNKIEICVNEDDKRINISIKDNSYGLLPANSNHLFKPENLCGYSNLLQQVKRDMILCKKIIEEHHGLFDYKSSEGLYTIYNFSIPIDNSLPMEDTPNLEIENHDVPNWKAKDILIVDDVLSNYKYLKGVLNKTKANIDWVQTGKDAIDYCKGKPDVDLILMDIHMPGISGIETTKQIRMFNKEVVIVAQTAYDMHGENEKCFSVGCNGYLPMPIKPAELLGEISKHI